MNNDTSVTVHLPKAVGTLWARRGRIGRWLVRQFVPNLGTLLLVGIFLWVSGVYADPRRAQESQPADTLYTTVNYQGRLANSDGSPVDGSVGLTFALYQTEDGGSPIWSEVHNAVPVSDGLFAVRLGSVNPLSSDLLAENLYLEIQVNTDPPMTPREKLAAVPYAMQAGTALTVPDGSITTTKVADGAIVPSKMGSGSVLNRYTVEWFGDETPCTTSSTDWVDCGVTLGGGLINAFPLPQPGTIRHYYLMVAKGDNLSTTGTTYVRVVKRDGGAVVYEFDTGRDWAWSDYQVWRYSGPIMFDEPAHLDLKIRLSVSGSIMWLYRVWVMAEDIVP